MPITAEASVLRQRAGALREVASAIEASPVFDLDRDAGELTWQGARPRLCESLLSTCRRQLRDAIRSLHWQARTFEQRATELEATERLRSLRAEAS
jgi:hypothetical protein